MDEMQRLNSDVAKLKHTVYGNGEPGLVGDLRDLKRSHSEATGVLKSVRESVDAMVKADAAQVNKREGSRRTLQQIRAVAIVILGVLSAGGTWLFATLQTLAQDLGPLLP